MIISASDYEIFAEKGLMRIEGLIPDSVVAPARELVYSRLAKAGLWRGGAWKGKGDETLKLEKTALKDISKSGVFKDLQTADVLDIARQLVNGEEVRAEPHPSLLFTSTNASKWVLPYGAWHLDLPRLGPLGAPGVQMFAFLDTVSAGGGGTLFVSGSHRLLNDKGFIRSRDLKTLLKEHAYFRDLMDKSISDRNRFLSETHSVDDVPLQVVEITGAPGDVFFTDLRLLHAISPNAQPNPRLMVTQRFPREAVADHIYA